MALWYGFSLLVAHIALMPMLQSVNDLGGSKKANFQNHHIATKIVPCWRARQADSNGENGLWMQKILRFEVWTQHGKFWLKCHMVVKKCILMTWNDNLSWWCGMMMWHDDMEWWCGMLTCHDDVVWWHGMLMWHDDMAWWSGMMTSMHAFVLGMIFRTFMHLLMRNCKMINIWSEWKNYSHITHLFYSLSCYEVNAWL